MIIRINNVNCFVENASSSELEKINKALTCFAPGYRYNQLFKRKLWDGKVNIFKANKFPTGCLPTVLNAVSAQLCDERSVPILKFNKSTNISLRDYQLESVNKSLSNKFQNLYWPRGVIKAPTGCVDKDTEYLSPTGWKKISEYDGGLVAQYNKDDTAEFVSPEYIKLPCEEFWYIKTKFIDQMMSEDHNVVYFDRHIKKLRPIKRSLVWVINKQKTCKSGFYGSFLSSFHLKCLSQLDISEFDLRLQVAVMADGHFSSKTNRVTIRLKKQYKKDRLEYLLKETKTEYKRRECPSAIGFSVFSFYAPLRLKEYDNRFWSCSYEQLKIICEECLQWDGNRINQFYTGIKNSADFIQYAFSAIGHRTSLSGKYRVREGKKPAWEYQVYISKKRLVTMEHTNIDKKAQFIKKPSIDGFKYCFTVPSGMLIFRRNNKICVTGNSGKSQIAAAMIQVSNLRTLFIVNQQELQKQAVDTFIRFGIETGTSIDERKKVTVITIQSLMQFGHKTNKKTASGKKRTDQEVAEINFKKQAKALLAIEYLNSIEQIFVDEAHGIASTLDKGNMMFQALALMPNAFMRWGLTATPFERDNYSNLLLEGATGSLVVEISTKELIEKGYLSAPEITMYSDDPNEDINPSWPECYTYGIVLNNKRNNKIVNEVIKLTKPCIILVTRKDHGSILEKKFKDQGIFAPFISGSETKETRQKALSLLKSGELEIAIATKIWKQGLDIPNLQAIILAAGGGEPSMLKQILGRGMRIAEGKKKFQFIDFFDNSPPRLRKHSNVRKRTWRSEGYSVRMEHY